MHPSFDGRALLRKTLLSLGLFLVLFTVAGAWQWMTGGTPLAHAQGEGGAGLAQAVAASQTTLLQRLMSGVGLFGFLGIAWLLSNNRKAISWKLVGIGVALQLGFAVFILKTPIGAPLFDAATDVFNRLLKFTESGSAMLFWGEESFARTFVFGILPTVIFFSSLMSVLYYLGVMQRIVSVFAWAMQRTMGTSGSETLSAAANIFVGQTEAPLMIKPYVGTMTNSELMAVMTGGFATVAGGVMAAYIGFLAPYFPDIAGHLLAASVMSAPAALVVAKIMYPETEVSPTAGDVKMDAKSDDANVIDAAARGASEGMTLAINIAAMLLAFVALIAMINFAFAFPSYTQHSFALTNLLEAITTAGLTVPAELLETCGGDVAAEARIGCITQLQTAFPDQAGSVSAWRVFTLETLFGVVFWPIAFLMGVPASDCYQIGQLLGTKMVVNEFVAYVNLNALLQNPEVTLQPRSVIIAAYALCGFANFSSIAIQIGGIGSIAPKRRGDLARLGMRAMIGGSIAAFMTATIAGMLI